MRCQGRPDGKCPDNRNDDTVHNTIGDLFLCNACEEFSWPSARTTTRSANNKKKSSASSSSSVYASTKASKGSDRDATLTGLTVCDKEEAENLVSECSTCLLPVDSGDKNGLICSICCGFHHLKCITLCSFYRQFIRGFSQKIQVFRPLLVKNAPYTWTDEHQKAFEELKRVMTEAPICLHFPEIHGWIITLPIFSTKHFSTETVNCQVAAQ